MVTGELKADFQLRKRPSFIGVHTNTAYNHLAENKYRRDDLAGSG